MTKATKQQTPELVRDRLMSKLRFLGWTNDRYDQINDDDQNAWDLFVSSWLRAYLVTSWEVRTMSMAKALITQLHAEKRYPTQWNDHEPADQAGWTEDVHFILYGELP